MIRDKSLCKLIIAMFFNFIIYSYAEAFTIELTEQQVQEVVISYFPVEHITPLATLNVYRPLVFLDQKSNRIGLAFSILVDVPNIMKGEGQGAFDGDLEYRQETGEFYLHDPKIRRLDVQEFPTDIAVTLQQALQEIMGQSFPLILVYKLQDDDIAQRMAKSILSSVAVRKGKLIIELSSPVPNLKH
jgi:hypothetical protein